MQKALDFRQQGARGQAQAVGDPNDQGKRRLPLSALELSEIGTIDVRKEREFVLGNLPLQTLGADDRTEGRCDLRLEGCGALGDSGLN